ncbi:MAG: DNA cytosine methyltransferase [Marinospirillum sp.]|nr:DNA cytosine methyltransferase [Marinospirillum sp.]
MTCQGRPSDDIKPRMGLGIGLPTDPQNTLSSAHHHAVALIKSAGFSAGNSANSHGIGYTEEGTPPLRSSSSGTNQVPTIVAEEATGFSTSTSGDGYWREGIHALRARPNDSHENLVALPLNSCCLPIHDKATRHQGGGETRNSDGSGNGLGIGDPLAPSYTLTSGDRHAVLAGSSGQQSLTPWEQQGCRIQGENGVAPTVMSNPAGGMKIEPVLASNAFDQATHKMMPTCEMVVRRLTPVECERLQGFPDNWTLLPYGTHKKVEAEMKAYYEHHFGRTLSEEEVQSFCADGPRYKAIGNSMAVPVMDFIGKRIDQYMRGKKGGACESQNNQRSQ